MRVDFYHLSAAPLERVLPSVCEKLLAGGERVVVVAGEDLLHRIDRDLWTWSPTGFLPHGMDRPESQPVLLSTSPEPANGARNIALADGVWRDEALAFDRTFYFFDGSTLDAARQGWRGLNGREDVELHYWKQDERGRWVEGP